MTSPQALSEEEEEDVTGTSHKVGAEKQARKHRPVKKNVGKGYVYKRKKKTCKICKSEVFDLNRHMKVHQKDASVLENVDAKRKRRKCEECESEVFNMWGHMQTVHGKQFGKPRRKKCPECNIEVALKSLARHMQNFHKEKVEDQLKKQTCDRCKRKISAAIDMERHVIGHEKDEACQTQSGQYVCDNCMNRYDDADKLAMHRILYCSTFLTETVCFKCKRTLQDLEKHLIGHEENEACQTPFGPYICGNCMKRYDDVHKLSTHRRKYCSQVVEEEHSVEEGEIKETGSGIKQTKKMTNYRCKYHGIQFDTAGEFKSHNDLYHRKVQKTDSLQPVTCLKCSQTFPNFYQLKYHHTAVHMDKGEGVYKCHLCRKKFNDKILFQDHMKTHPRPIRTKCRFCHLMFVNSATLKQHELYKHQYWLCQFCGKKLLMGGYYKHLKRCRQKHEAGVDKLNKTIKQTDGTDKRIQHLVSDADGVAEGIKEESGPTGNAQINVSGIEPNTHVVSDADGQEGLKHESGPLENEPTNISQRYKCSKCPVIFEFKPNYESHKQKCQRSTTSDDMETDGTQDMQEKRESYQIYTCEKCLDIFNRSINLISHEAIHRWVECELCEDVLPDEYTLQMHKLLECPGKFEIAYNICQKEEKAESGGVYQSESVSHGQGNAESGGDNYLGSVGHGQASGSSASTLPEIVDKGQMSGSSASTVPVIMNEGQASSGSAKKCKKKTDMKNFLCCICNNRFEKADHLLMHELTHKNYYKKEKGQICTEQSSEKKDNVCDSCDVSFMSEKTLQEHKTLVALNKVNYPIRCPYCFYSDKTPGHLVQSECDFLQHKKLFKFSCQFCSHHFKDMTALKRHLNKTHDFEDKKQCPGCSQWFGAQRFQQHKEYMRKAVERLECKCFACGIVFDSVEKLDEHNTVYKIRCRICSQHFWNGNAFQSHVKSNHNLSAMKDCKLDYILCKHCDQSFKRMSELSAHVKQVILETEPTGGLLCSWEGRFKTCFSCGMAFQKQSDYDIHKSVWNFTCYYCHQHFMRPCMLYAHMKEHGHQDKVGVSCKLCNHKFDSVVEKRAHESRIHWRYRNDQHRKQGRFPCKLCGEVMPTVCQLDIHFQTKKCIKELETIDETCILCRARLLNSYEKSVHMKDHEAEGELRCDFCKKQFESLSSQDFYKHETPQRKKSMCTVCNTSLVASCQIEVHERSCIKGKTCAYCLETIKDSSDHKRYKRNGYQCTCCGIKALAQCVKKPHDTAYRYICRYCNQHFKTFTELLDHLTPTIWKHEKRKAVCSYCGEKVQNEDQRGEHESLFKFRCLICKKHFSTALETANHHQTKHSKKKIRTNTSMSFHNILKIYLRKAQCHKVKKVAHKSAARRKGVQYQIGSIKFSLLPSTSTKAKKDSLSESADTSQDSTSNTKTKEDMLSESANPTPDREGIISEHEQQAHDRVSDKTCTSKDVCENKPKLDDNVIGLLYICTKCNLSFEKLSEVENHECNVCCYCNKHFYGSDVRVKKKRHEEECSYFKRLSEEGTSIVKEGEDTDSCKGDLELYSTSEKEKYATLATDGSENQEEAETEAVCTSIRSKDDDATVVMDAGEKQHEARDEAISIRKKGDNVTLAADAGEKQHEARDEAISFRSKEDDDTMATDVSAKQYEVEDEAISVGSKDDDDDVTVVMDASENQHEAGDEAVSVRSKDDVIMATDVSAKQYEVEDEAISKVDDVTEATGVREKQLEVGHEGVSTRSKEDGALCDPAMEDNDRDKKEDGEITLKSGARSEVVNKEERAIETQWDNVDWGAIGRKSSRKRKKVQRLVEEPEMKTHVKAMCYCRRVFKNKNFFNKHQSENSLDGIRCICIHCNMELKTKCHIKYHLSQYPYTCTKCKQRFDEPKLLDRHRKTCIRCNLCDETYFGHENQLLEHKVWHHIDWKDLKLTSDDESDEQTDVEKESVRNEIRGRKMEVCKECNSQVLFLKKHMQGVHGIVQKTCQLCHKTVTDIKQHRREAHKNICSICKREFSEQKQFNKHLIGHEKDNTFQTPSGSYVCVNCHKRYDSRTELITHKRCFCSKITYSEKNIENGDKDSLQTVTASAKHQQQNEQKRPDENTSATDMNTSVEWKPQTFVADGVGASIGIKTVPNAGKAAKPTEEGSRLPLLVSDDEPDERTDLEKDGVENEIRKMKIEICCKECNCVVLDLKRHMREVHRKVYRTCHLCHKTVANVKQHRRKAHTSICRKCKREFLKLELFNKHLIGHEKDEVRQTRFGSFVCLNCNKRYEKGRWLKAHRKSYCSKITNGEKDIANTTNICEKGDKDSLQTVSASSKHQIQNEQEVLEEKTRADGKGRPPPVKYLVPSSNDMVVLYVPPIPDAKSSAITLDQQGKVSSANPATGTARVSINLPSVGDKGRSPPIKYLVRNGKILMSVPCAANKEKSSTRERPICNQERGRINAPLLGTSAPLIGTSVQLVGNRIQLVGNSVPSKGNNVPSVGNSVPPAVDASSSKMYLGLPSRAPVQISKQAQGVCNEYLTFPSTSATCKNTPVASSVSMPSVEVGAVDALSSKMYLGLPSRAPVQISKQEQGVCNICKRRVLPATDLEMHLIGHEMDEACQTQSGQHVCVYCMKKYDSAHDKAIHQMAYCFTTSKGSVVSRQSQNNQDIVSEVSGAYTCSKCKRNHRTDRTLKFHMFGHEWDEACQSQFGQHVCENCMKRYDDAHKLDKHEKYYCLMVTTSEKQHVCHNEGDQDRVQTFDANEPLTPPSTSATSKNTPAASSRSMLSSVGTGAVDDSSSKRDLDLPSKAPAQDETKVCDRCERQFLTATDFKKHLIGHLKDIACQTQFGCYVCANCLKRYDSEYEKVIHHMAYCCKARKGSVLSIQSQNYQDDASEVS